ncbi:MAG TPA: hypothetical protein VE955_08590 [Candidatus Dormibacteraeota bacterium]|nr:hypothetical protein [Candidatus Dormibacteraeota bacterium]
MTSRSLGWKLYKLHLHRVHRDAGSYAKVNRIALYQLPRAHTAMLAPELSERQKRQKRQKRQHLLQRLTILTILTFPGEH